MGSLQAARHRARRRGVPSARQGRLPAGEDELRRLLFSLALLLRGTTRGGIRTRDRLTHAARTQTPYRHRRAAPALRNLQALRTPPPWLPPPPAARPASASRHRARTPAPSSQVSCDRADRGTPARTAPSDAPGRDGWRRGDTLLCRRLTPDDRRYCESAIAH